MSFLYDFNPMFYFFTHYSTKTYNLSNNSYHLFIKVSCCHDIYIYRYRYKVFLNKSQEGIPALNFNLGCLNIRTPQIYSDYLKKRSKKKCPPPFSPPAPPPLLLLSLSADLCHRLCHVPAASRPAPATASADNDNPLPIPLLGPFPAVSTWADTV